MRSQEQKSDDGLPALPSTLKPKRQDENHHPNYVNGAPSSSERREQYSVIWNWARTGIRSTWLLRSSLLYDADCVCGGVMENRSTIPRFSYDAMSWKEGVLGAVLLIVTVGWRALLMVGILIGMENAAL